MILPTSFLEVDAHCNCYDVLTDSTIDLSEIKYQSTDRYPQTVIHDIVAAFLIDKIEGKQKKVLVLGYDGYREDALENIFGMEQSAVKTIAKEGGLFHSYAGANGNQDTSTAPGLSLIHIYIPDRYEIPSDPETITSEKAGEVYYSAPNRIVLFYKDATVTGEYTKLGTFDATQEFVSAVENNPVVEGWSNKIVSIRPAN